MPDLASDYAAGAPEVRPFLPAEPRAIFAAPPSARPWAPALVDALRAYQTAIGATGQVRGTEAAILTGQQPGLFTGPLYTIYKAVTAIRVAREVELRTGTPCTPVFWLGSDDHDFEEMRNAWIVTRQHGLLSLRYEPASDAAGLPMYRVPAEDSLHELIDQMATQAPGSEFRDEIAGFLHGSLEASASFAEWTARILARLFQGSPLVFFTPELPAARALAVPVMAREIETPLAATRAVNEAGRALEAAGYGAQVVKGGDDCNFFLEMGGRRRKVTFSGDAFHIPEEKLRCTPAELRQWLDDAPERFSPNVALRCIVQQALFPAAAYVAGPGEIAYWAQFGGVFRHFGLPMPIVYPRARAVLTSIKLGKLLEKSGLAFDDFARPPEELLERVLRATGRHPAAAVLESHHPRVVSAAEALAADVAALRTKDAAADLARGFADQVAASLDRLDRALLRADQARLDAASKQVERLANTFGPLRKPQERVLSIFSFLFEQGWDLIPRLIESLDIESFNLNVVEL